MAERLKRRYSKTKPVWNRNNKILLVLIIIQVLLFLSAILFSTFFHTHFILILKIILSVLLVSVSLAVILLKPIIEIHLMTNLMASDLKFLFLLLYRSFFRQPSFLLVKKVGNNPCVVPDRNSADFIQERHGGRSR